MYKGCQLFKQACGIATASLWLSMGSFQAVFAQNPYQQINQQWQPLSDIVSPAQLNDIVRENVGDPAQRAAIAQSATGYQQGDFTVVTFHNQDFCGRGGCWVFGYQPSVETTIFRTLVATQIPPDGPLVELIDSNLEVPCVRFFAYLSLPLTAPEETTACYYDGTWQ